MSNSTSNLDLISVAQAQKEVTVNALLDAASPAMLFGRRAQTSGGLTWGYYGGAMMIGGTPTAIGNGSLLLTASATNYLEADPATGAVSANTTGFTAGMTPLYSIVVGASTVTSYTDFRTGGGGGGGAVASVNGQTGEVVLSAADVGADAGGTASAAVSAHVAASDPHGQYALESTIGQANGIAGLGSDGKVPAAQLPASATTGGTVTSVGLSTPGVLYNVSGSPVTSAGTLTLTLINQAVNSVLAGPASGSAGAPSFRALVGADLPLFGASGASHAAGAVPDPGATAGTTRYLREDGTWSTPSGTASGTVTSVAASVPGFLQVTGSPITSAGTLAIAYSGTALPVANGGTGATTAAGALNALLPAQPGNGGKFLTTDGTSASWAAASGGGSSTSIAGTNGTTGGDATATGGTSSTSGIAGGGVILTGGTPGATAAGGVVSAIGGPGGTTSGAGGAVSMTGGPGTASTATGGTASLIGGTPGATGVGGTAAVTGGAGGTTSGTGGQVQVTGGNATAGAGGAVTVKGGTGAGGASLGGAVLVQGGNGPTAGDGGTATVQGGTGGSSATGGVASVKGGSGLLGGAVTVIGGAGTGGGGGAASMTGGAGAGNGAGGAASIVGGAGAGAGNGGNVVLTPGAGGASGVRGNVVLNGTGAALATAATGGFTCIPTCAGAPTGTPASIPAGTVPMVFDSTNFNLYVYVSGAWKKTSVFA